MPPPSKTPPSKPPPSKPRRPAKPGLRKPAVAASPAAPDVESASGERLSGERVAGERVAKVLARAGVASRRDAERMIEAGRVAVNGVRLESPARNVTPEDAITVDGAPVAEPEPPRLWRYHKPAGLVTSARDEQGRETVFDHLPIGAPGGLPRVMTVGRLDLASEGLLLLTNDGALKRRLELPSTGWLRRYRVRVHGRPTPRTLAPLERGITVDGVDYQPMAVAIDDGPSDRRDAEKSANAWLTIGLREGKNREIRRALEALGFSVNRLIRIGYGPFRLGELPRGGWEEVKARVLREQLGLSVETPAQREKRARDRKDEKDEKGAPAAPRGGSAPGGRASGGRVSGGRSSGGKGSA